MKISQCVTVLAGFLLTSGLAIAQEVEPAEPPTRSCGAHALFEYATVSRGSPMFGQRVHTTMDMGEDDQFQLWANGQGQWVLMLVYDHKNPRRAKSCVMAQGRSLKTFTPPRQAGSPS